MKRILPKIFLSIGTLLLTLLLLEGVFRVFDIRGYHEDRISEWRHALLGPAERLPGVNVQFRPNTTFRFIYDNNPRGYFDENNALVCRINKWGFRGPDFEKQKVPGTRRVMVLGDSFTFGEGVRLEDTFVRRMEEKLRRKTAQSLEVLNFGVSAWATRDETAYFKQAGVQFAPDLVVVAYVLNDADHAGGLGLWNNFRREYEDRRFQSSYLINFIYTTIKRSIYGRRYVRKMAGSAVSPGERGKWDLSFSMLSEIDKSARSRGMKFAVVLFPFMFELNDNYPFTDLHRMITAGLTQYGIPVLDLLPAFKGQDYLKLWAHPSDQHPNEKGHEIAAEAISDFVIQHNLL